MVALQIRGFFLDQEKMPVVVLQDASGQRILPIWIGPAEARSIIVELEHIQGERPLAHDILARTFLRHGFAMASLEIYGVSAERGYNARIRYRCAGRGYELEVRPSDGLALAVRLKAPVLAPARLLGPANLSSFIACLHDPCAALLFPAESGEGSQPEAEHSLQRGMLPFN